MLFSNAAGRKRTAALQSALSMLDSGSDRSKIEAATGVVVGVCGATWR